MVLLKIGRYYAYKKKYKPAVKILGLLKNRFKNIGDDGLYAESLHCIGNSGKAIEHLEEVIKEFPKSAFLYERRAHILREIYQEERAILDLDKAIELNEDNYMNWYSRGLAYQDIGDYEKAIRDFEESVKREDESTVTSTYHSLAKAYNEIGDFQNAVKYSKKTVNAPDAIPFYYYMLSTSLQNLGRTREAIEVLHKGMELLDRYERKSDRGLSIFVQHTNYSYGAFKSFQRSTEPTLSFRLPLAEMYMNIEEYEKAGFMLDEADKMYPNSFDVWALRGRLYMMLGEITKAMDEFERAIQLDTDNIKGYLEKSYAYGHLGDEAGELNALNEFRGKHPDSPIICYKIAEVYNKYEKYDQALNKNDELISLEGNDYLNYMQRADILTNMNRYGDAAQAYLEAIHLYDHSYARYQRSSVLYLDQKYEDSLVELNRAVELDPQLSENPNFYIGLGHNYSATNQTTKAIQQYSEAIKLNPENLYYLLYRIESYMELKDYENAIKDCTHAILLSSENIPFYEIRADAYFAKEDYEKARKDIMEWMYLDPQSYEVQFNLGKIDYKRNEHKQALNHLEKAIQLNAAFGPSYLYKAYIQYDVGQMEQCIYHLIEWSNCVHRDMSFSEIKEAIRSLDGFDEDVLEESIEKLSKQMATV